MFSAIEAFLRTFNVNYPLLWALLVMAMVTVTSLTLYLFWEVVLRLLSAASALRQSRRREQG